MNKRFERAKIAEFLNRSTDCAWRETWARTSNGQALVHIVIDGLNNTPRATVQRAVTAYGGQMRKLGDVLVISRRKS